MQCRGQSQVGTEEGRQDDNQAKRGIKGSEDQWSSSGRGCGWYNGSVKQSIGQQRQYCADCQISQQVSGQVSKRASERAKERVGQHGTSRSVRHVLCRGILFEKAEGRFSEAGGTSGQLHGAAVLPRAACCEPRTKQVPRVLEWEGARVGGIGGPVIDGG